MLGRRLLALVPVLAIGATGALVATSGTAVAAPPPTTAGKTYVALGDSYAAGFGLPATEGTPTGQPVVGCAQTTGDYPHLLAASLGLTLTDVTCSGAKTTDFSAPQQVTGGAAPAQLDVFKTVQPDLVSITIGGNDLGFSGISSNCLAASPTGPTYFHPTYASCQEWFTSTAADGGADVNPYDKVAATVAKVGDAIKAVQAAAPNAKVVVLDYPAIVPDAANTPAAGCFAANALVPPLPVPGLPISLNSTLPFTDVDVPFLQVLQQQLNEGIGQVATANGAAFAEIYADSLAHSACSPETTRWVEPIVPGGGGTNRLHPNLAGTTAMAAALAPVVTALFAPPTTPTPTSTSTPPATTPAGTGTRTTTSGGLVPLADTGVQFPVSWLVGLGVVLLVSGAASVQFGRRRSASARH